MCFTVISMINTKICSPFKLCLEDQFDPQTTKKLVMEFYNFTVFLYPYEFLFIIFSFRLNITTDYCCAFHNYFSSSLINIIADCFFQSMHKHKHLKPTLLMGISFNVSKACIIRNTSEKEQFYIEIHIKLLL